MLRKRLGKKNLDQLHSSINKLYDVVDHTNHIFSESLSSGDDNDQDEDLQKDKDKDTQTQKKKMLIASKTQFMLYLSNAGGSRNRGYKIWQIFHLSAHMIMA